MTNELNNLVEAIDQTYRAEHLKVIFQAHIKLFYQTNSQFILDQDEDEFFEDAFSTVVVKKKYPKWAYTHILAFLFYKEELFKRFRKSLPETLTMLLDYFVWNKPLRDDAVKTELNCDVISNSNKYREELNKQAFLLYFSEEYSGRYWVSDRSYYYWIGLSSAIKVHLQQFYDKPDDYFVNPVDTIEATGFIYKGQETIFDELPRLQLYISKGSLSTTQSGIVQANSIKKMKRVAKVREFFDERDKVLSHLRTGLLAGMLKQLNNLETSQPLAVLKALITAFEIGGLDTWQVCLPHLKGVARLDNYRIENHDPFNYKLISQLAPGEWFSMENFLKSCAYRDLVFIGIASYGMHHLYINKYHDHYSDKEYVNFNNFRRFVTFPYIKSTIFMLAAFGLLDIAYNRPDVTEQGETYISGFDELKYFRINELGAYIFGKNDSYEIPETKEQARYIISEQALVITLDKEDHTKSYILDNFCTQLSPTRFKTCYSTFLKDCRTLNDIQAKINLFHDCVSAKPPKLWNDFF